VRVREGLLHRMQSPAGAAQPLDRRDRLALTRHRQGQAGEDPSAIDVNGARTTRALVATLLGAGEMQPLSKRVEQTDPGFDVERNVLPIDCEDDRSHRRFPTGARSVVRAGRVVEPMFVPAAAPWISPTQNAKILSKARCMTSASVLL